MLTAHGKLFLPYRGGPFHGSTRPRTYMCFMETCSGILTLVSFMWCQGVLKKKLSIKAKIQESFLGASITRKPKPVRKLVMIWNVDIKMP